MKQTSLALAGFELVRKHTRKRVFLDEMNRVVPWEALVARIEPHTPKLDPNKGGRPAFPALAMLRIHFMQQWFGLSDPAMEEALHDVPLYLEFSGLDSGLTRLPDETTILRFRHLLEEHALAEQILATVNALLTEKGLLLKTGTAIDATLIAAPSSTKNKDKARDPEMHASKKGKQWYFGMKAHIGVDADSGLVHTVVCSSGNVADITQAALLLHGEERRAHGDAGYVGAQKRAELIAFEAKRKERALQAQQTNQLNPAQQDPYTPLQWHIAMRPGKRKALDKTNPEDQRIHQLETQKASIRAKVEHPFRIMKRQFGYVKVRYRGLKKNAAQQITLFALGNLWMARHVLG